MRVQEVAAPPGGGKVDWGAYTRRVRAFAAGRGWVYDLDAYPAGPYWLEPRRITRFGRAALPGISWFDHPCGLRDAAGKPAAILLHNYSPPRIVLEAFAETDRDLNGAMTRAGLELEPVPGGRLYPFAADPWLLSRRDHAGNLTNTGRNRADY